MLLIAYTMVIGLLFLVVPLTAQALVNTIAAGVLIQPLFVLAFLLLLGLTFAGALRTLQLYLVEMVQRRIFARIALKLAHHIPRVWLHYYQATYGPELVNRFFDTITLQKSVGKLLLEVPTAFFQIIIGLALMAIYSPLLLIFDLFIILALVFLVWLGRNGAITAYEESSKKYGVAGWLEDMARCQLSLKLNGLPNIAESRADQRVIDYLEHREAHFKVLLRQSVFSFAIQALATTGILALGGWLVINQQLSIGQLVAAELVMMSIIAALDKLTQNLDTYYDLLTGLSKVGNLTDMEQERRGGQVMPRGKKGVKIECNNLCFAFPNGHQVLKGLNLTIEPGEQISIVGRNGAGKTTLGYLMTGLLEPSQGLVSLNGYDTRTLDLNTLRKNSALVSESSSIFEGTIEENIVLDRNVNSKDIQWALEMVLLKRELMSMPKGIKTPLISEGRNISLGQRQRIIIARAILERPQLLVLDEAFTGLDQASKLTILDNLFDQENAWTIVDISHDIHMVLRTQTVHVIQDHHIVETGNIADLTKNKQSAFAELFPSLSKLTNLLNKAKEE
ncbi:MAG: ABC transporter ATP-binding protein [Cyanobacteria bacterium HKST-UBA05]|nr:ABC transporter ATP-binding protein [Cyanobacteria bacterium HKST-UBA05]